jgi:hypothetical protein
VYCLPLQDGMQSRCKGFRVQEIWEDHRACIRQITHRTRKEIGYISCFRGTSARFFAKSTSSDSTRLPLSVTFDGPGPNAGSCSFRADGLRVRLLAFRERAHLTISSISPRRLAHVVDVIVPHHLPSA